MRYSRDYIGGIEHACLRAGLILRPSHLFKVRTVTLEEVQAFVQTLPSTSETQQVLAHLETLKGQQ